MEGVSGRSGLLRWVPGDGLPREVGHLQRLIEMTAVVALWIGFGQLLDVKVHAASFAWKVDVYLLFGIPLVAVFQLWVRRRPITGLWVRDGRPVANRVALRLLGVLLAVFPTVLLIRTISDDPDGVVAQAAYAIAAMGGAFAGAYAYLHFTRETWKYLAYCLLTAGVIGVIPYLASDVHTLTHPVEGHSDTHIWFGIESLLTYLPVVYVMEEVAFRGAFDSHAHHEADRLGLLTAIYVSVLWGTWHAPLFGWDHILGLVVYQGAVGTFLSIWWRKSGNLGVSGTTHALIDSIRNFSGEGP
jgi:membrane protease YdiL (CAAX protease family)